MIFWGGGALLAVVLLVIAFGGATSQTSNISDAPAPPTTATTPPVTTTLPVTTTPPLATSAPPPTTITPPPTTTTPVAPAPPPLYKDRVPGAVVRNPFAGIGSDPQALAKLKYWDVWCGWNTHTGNVTVHITFRNPLIAKVDATISPAYVIRNGGTHGDGATDQQDVIIAARGYRSWYGNAGQPSGVPKFSPIDSCSPSLTGVSLG